ncbi:isoprenylcysteine carboxylmethyltransferase family protein [uncultured Brevundimonas sp.]|uniref:methyltransferase family protein n=1 Tax=uncultured Brevundimonas sp. TaxID=213418 RepID=UPI002638BFB0|nr:isoprenylcysteine carboxylmethyltransferase family protein [uncultured Brevundimonas sp.]
MSATEGFDLQRVQKIRKAALGAGMSAILALALFTASRGGEPLHEGVEAFGLALIVVCIVGRAWCSLYIGGRKKAEIVDRGPYSISRNPLYLFSFMGAFGAGAQTGSLTLATAFLAVAMLVFHFTIRREEAWLSDAFGQSYRDYCARTPRFGPDFSRWRDAESLDVRPRFFLITLRDGLIFLLAIPLFEAIEALQHIGWLGTLLRLP